MRKATVWLVAVAVPALALGCSGAAADAGGGRATVTIPGSTFEVSNVRLSSAAGEDGYFHIEGDDAAHPDEDCLPGLGGGLALYGSMPVDVATVAELSGRELPFEFSGDGDDFNLCFVGSNGLFGVERGTVRFGAVEGDTIAFTFSGSFIIYDGEGGSSPSQVTASGSGIAHVDAMDE